MSVFFSAIWNISDSTDYTYVISFGTDTWLTITPGWDNVTGLGTPNSKAFADCFHPVTRHHLASSDIAMNLDARRPPLRA